VSEVVCADEFGLDFEPLVLGVEVRVSGSLRLTDILSLHGKRFPRWIYHN
jgi:hypothetical protein